MGLDEIVSPEYCYYYNTNIISTSWVMFRPSLSLAIIITCDRWACVARAESWSREIMASPQTHGVTPSESLTDENPQGFALLENRQFSPLIIERNVSVQEHLSLDWNSND